METLKKYIINFYKTHDKYDSIDFNTVKEALSFKTDEELNTLLKSLIQQSFIEPTFDADNLIYEFRLIQ